MRTAAYNIGIMALLLLDE